MVTANTTKVIDLESSRHVDDSIPEDRTLTYNYAAPEHLLMNELSGASDVYSLGCVMHDALHPQLWFGKPGDGDSVRNVKLRMQEHLETCGGRQGYSHFLLICQLNCSSLACIQNTLGIVTPHAIATHPNPIVHDNNRLKRLLAGMVDVHPENRPSASDVYADLLTI